eukprot:m51a1_g7965 putative potential trna splicing endonuclease subunit (257) ;mRNA; r:243471-244349
MDGARVVIECDAELNVRGAEQMRALWDLGWFGKGTLSRSKPLCCCPAGASDPTYRPASTPRTRTSSPAPAPPAARLTSADEQRVLAAETVQLTPAEAWYLAHEAGVLRVANIESRDELWALLAGRAGGAARLARVVAAYRHYRMRGWAVRSGIKLGADFVLYSAAGRAHTHSRLAVRVVRPGEQWRWAAVQAHTRNAQNVAKQFALCTVDVAGDDAAGSQSALVSHVVLRRWAPERDREPPPQPAPLAGTEHPATS